MGILELVFPKRCVGCGNDGEYICSKCQGQLWPPIARCSGCGGASLGGWTHGECKAEEGIERLVSGLSYHGMVQRCLKKVKYKSSWEIVKLLYQISGLPKIEEGVVVSVPMWRQKERMRGFNQAAIIAELIAKDNGLKQIELLERVRETKPMYGLDKQAREVNVNGAFRIKQNLRDKLVGARVILVDDVWTTGATMKECGKLLKSAGVREIWAITLAR